MKPRLHEMKGVPNMYREEQLLHVRAERMEQMRERIDRLTVELASIGEELDELLAPAVNNEALKRGS